MRPSRSSIAALVLLASAFSSAAAQQPGVPEAGGATFLLLPVGGRAAALGQAAIADGGSSEAAFWNPAGLALLPGSEVAVHYASTFASNNTVLSGYLHANRLGVVGVAAYLVDFGSQEVTPGPGLPIGRIAVKNIELLASYATQFADKLTIGLNYKLIQFRQDCSGDCGTARTVVGTTHGVDLGMQYALFSNALRIGVAVRHAGFKLQLENREQADPLPTRVQVGFAYRVFLPAQDGASDRLDARFLFDFQDAWGEYNNPDARFGVELGYGEVVRLRGGYAFLHSESSGPSLGLGLQFGRFTLDFARVFYDSSNFDEPVHISLRATL